MFTALGLFHTSHRRAYNSVDVKVPYTLLSCTASLEYFGGFSLCVGNFIWSVYNLFANGRMPTHSPWPDHIAQYSLVGYLASKRKHRILTSITAFLGCEDYLDPLWSMKPFTWTLFITWLVSRFIEIWKRDHGTEAATNNRAAAFKFNDNRGLDHQQAAVWWQQDPTGEPAEAVRRERPPLAPRHGVLLLRPRRRNHRRRRQQRRQRRRQRQQ